MNENSDGASKTNMLGSMLDALMRGLDRVGTHVDRGPSYLMMAIGSLTFIAAIGTEFLTRLGSGLGEKVAIGAPELAVMLGGSIILMLGGAALRVWDSLRAERAEERQIQLRLAAAERVEKLMLGSDQTRPSRPPV